MSATQALQHKMHMVKNIVNSKSSKSPWASFKGNVFAAADFNVGYLVDSCDGNCISLFVVIVRVVIICMLLYCSYFRLQVMCLSSAV